MTAEKFSETKIDLVKLGVPVFFNPKNGVHLILAEDAPKIFAAGREAERQNKSFCISDDRNEAMICEKCRDEFVKQARQQALREMKENIENILEEWECNCEGDIIICQKHEIKQAINEAMRK